MAGHSKWANIQHRKGKQDAIRSKMFSKLAKEITVPARRINEIVLGKRSISADTALRLSCYFGTSERFWLNLQTRYELEVERDRLGARLTREVTALRKTG